MKFHYIRLLFQASDVKPSESTVSSYFAGTKENIEVIAAHFVILCQCFSFLYKRLLTSERCSRAGIFVHPFHLYSQITTILQRVSAKHSRTPSVLLLTGFINVKEIEIQCSCVLHFETVDELLIYG